MDRARYLAQRNVADFVVFFAEYMQKHSVYYVSSYKKLKPEDRRFEATGVEQALARYAWPSTFVAPATDASLSCIAGESYKTYTWAETRQALVYLSSGLQDAVRQNDDEGVLRWSKAILDWGMGSRGTASYNYLAVKIKQQPARHLQEVQRLTSLDTARLDFLNLSYMSSGLSKIYSLCSQEGLIIYDSRVAAAFCQSVNTFLREQGIQEIHQELRFHRDWADRRTPTPPGPDKSVNHPGWSWDWRWLSSQLRCTWILQAALTAAPSVFAGAALPERTHRLEAALFMMGADLHWEKSN